MPDYISGLSHYLCISSKQSTFFAYSIQFNSSSDAASYEKE